MRSDSTGKEYCTLDSLDQGAIGLPCDKVQFTETDSRLKCRQCMGIFLEHCPRAEVSWMELVPG